MDPREHAIQEAIRGFEIGTYMSLRKAAVALNVPRSTIHSRMLGCQSHAIAHKNRQRLSPEQDESLKDWIIIEGSRFQPPSHPRDKEMAVRILHENGDHEALGKRWLQHFIARNPSVSSMVGRKIDSSRAFAASLDNIRAFLELFERTRTQVGVHQEDIWNIDETSLALWVCTNTQVVAKSTKKKTCVKSPENREWVSNIEAVSATGKKLKCLLIFKGNFFRLLGSHSKTYLNVSTRPQKMAEPPMKSVSTELKKNYTWLGTEGVWKPNPYFRRTCPPHTDVESMWQCRQNKIHCLYLPPHSSHVFQPLDLAPFSALKTKYRSEIAALSVLNDAALIKKERFVVSYNKAREKDLSERVIRAVPI
ncbi:hypothetical protein K3495_g3989 [Podosphaera aphanis]|nr:hypothetical protein K3495_g3989 [Podosphaera aphanis]